MATRKITRRVELEIERLVTEYGYSKEILQDFTLFILQKESVSRPQKAKSLPLLELKTKIYQHFDVKDTISLKKSGAFQMATSGIGKIDLSKKEGWEILYRKFIGILPHETNEQGYGCINGINIFKYNMPWNVFGLDPQVATTEEVKDAYRKLSKIYHPDIPQTGDSKIFERLTIFYKSLTDRF
ncbi:MAG: J domain-containing protein [Microcystis panniformis Mp_MB_F_20051200_S9]|jgi:hypothetical protein|uniref:J domain-containing protein n=1 Tax=Microcystis panniformis Mp_MB_F_20051200_S9 TaxID=2486223 RepID=A0A552Q450_9CHRO|nr:J domain-containing protein [Microcystis aeruginosa L211-07]NCS29858.1 J domain-containing protein [Microcystis aeruginosa F13-15]TRV51307.1 MAG: J domain-containing protein [Microcystis panniformis Mp_GB_SS_20050300_S99D]TRV51449.1 MAG: J domain-containing protein [Microcystis panniformis Mp_MB_F_20080800_S26D]TRV52891.1 MAG: J domain-containing protein [Microcystis panniformis Mp_GB_SS_20050300_S99]TRV63476.1 MAG: J domain-containing protein [Microcystis panniformis Mp_MB_F_20080800_S26]